MADTFTFRRFTVHQERCAMKVGTDGVILGAWAVGSSNILDIGTGTGLVALMMAQRYPDANVTAIDIDEGAAQQAAENVTASPFAERISVVHTALQDFHPNKSFDAIVCNPPFFEQSLTCPDKNRTISRHTTTLTFRELMTHAYSLLNDDGEMSVVIPTDAMSRMEEAACLAGFFMKRQCEIRTTSTKPPKRQLLSFAKRPVETFERQTIIIGSEEYKELTKDFYL